MPKKLIYLNNAATSWPKPKSVIKAVTEAMQRPCHEQSRGMSPHFVDYLDEGRNALAGFFNAAQPEHIVFTANATHGLNALIHGFAMSQKGRFHAVTSDLEHNAVLRPLNTLQRSGKVELTIVPFADGGYVSLESVKAALREDTRLVVLTHGSNVIGTLQDIRRIGTYLKSRGIYFIVDAAQTAGHVDIDLSRLDADALVFTGHKSLFGLPGIGGFHIRDPTRVEAYVHGGTGSHSQNPYQPDDMPLKFEAGTHNYPGVASLKAGVEFIERTGMRRIEAKTRVMTERMIKRLSEEDGITVHNKKPDLPIIAFELEGMDNSDVGYILLHRDGIVSRTGLHCAPLVHDRIDEGRGCVRLSPSYFNTSDDCEKAVSAIVRIAKAAGKR